MLTSTQDLRRESIRLRLQRRRRGLSRSCRCGPRSVISRALSLAIIIKALLNQRLQLLQLLDVGVDLGTHARDLGLEVWLFGIRMGGNKGEVEVGMAV